MVKDSAFLLPNPTNHGHTHIYIPNPDVSIQSPPGWGPWLKHFSLLRVSTFALLALLSLSFPLAHRSTKRQGHFVQSFLTVR